jgi:flagellar hook protein FlgE
MQKEADGLYSLHSSTILRGAEVLASTINTTTQRSFVDSLGQEHTVKLEFYERGDYVRIMLTSADINTGSDYTTHTLLWYDFRNGGESGISGCTLDEATRQLIVTFKGTGAELRLDLNDVAIAEGESLPECGSGEALVWKLPPMIFEEGTSEIQQSQDFILYPDRPSDNHLRTYVQLTVTKHEDGSLVGRLKDNFARGADVELYFDEKGWVSGYQFLKNAGSTSDPSVGEHAGPLVEGMHFMSSSTDWGVLNVDFGSLRVIDTTKPPKEEVIPEEVREEIPAEPLEEEVSEEIKAGFAPLSPASLSIDENGVLKRLQDSGDWEPVYLLACGQFAAMNSAEERNGVYYATSASGAIKVGVSGKDGMGTITAGTLEHSTTNLAHELSEMIRAQHAYAANTKVLSTIDDMLEELERL